MPRRRGIVHDQNTRDKIQAAHLIRRLLMIANGEIEKDARDLTVQVNAAKALLNKVLPDLQSVESYVDVEGEVGIRSVNVSGVKPTDP